MSTFAEIFILSASAGEELEATLRERSTAYDQMLRSMARSSRMYDGAGFVVATLLPVLQTSYSIDLMKGDSITSQRLSAASGFFQNVVSYAQGRELADKLDPSLFQREKLEKQFEDFNAGPAPGAGEAMLGAIQFLRECFLNLQAEEIALLVLN